jgi:anti-sigma factor RsiW
MNTLSISHIPEDLLERYAMGRLSRQDCARLHRHLLRCSSCQVHLQQIDEYVKVMKAALLISVTVGPAVPRKPQSTAWAAGS